MDSSLEAYDELLRQAADCRYVISIIGEALNDAAKNESSNKKAEEEAAAVFYELKDSLELASNNLLILYRMCNTVNAYIAVHGREIYDRIWEEPIDFTAPDRYNQGPECDSEEKDLETDA